MAHILDPKHLANDRDYCAALDELERVMDADADTPAGWRVDELAHLISEYETMHRAPGLSRPVGLVQSLAQSSAQSSAQSFST